MKKSNRYSRKSCKRGFISRRSFVNKFGEKVQATCVKSRALRSKGKRASIFLPKLKQGTLRKFGYSVHSPQKLRQRSLTKSIKNLGKNTVIRKLNAIRVLSKNTSPENSKKYEKDIHFVQKQKNKLFNEFVI